MLPTEDDCDACVPDYMKHKKTAANLLWSLQPFALTFIIVAILSVRRLFPFLSGETQSPSSQDNANGDGHLPTFKSTGKIPGASAAETKTNKPSRVKLSLVQVVFACNVGLSAVLVELLLCEISDSLNQAARKLALSITLPCLLFLLIVIAPALEVHSILAALGLATSSTSTGKKSFRRTWLSQLLALAIWICIFWVVGYGVLGIFLRDKDILYSRRTFLEGCLERIGVIGISLLAVLSGFAAVSAPWQAFGTKQAPVTDSDITKKQIGLENAEDMLHAKRSRLRALSKRMDEGTTAQGNFFSRMVGTFRGSSESQEKSTLELEIGGLETVRLSLANTLYTLGIRRSAQLRAKTALGRLINGLSYAFSIYCVYRLATTSLSTLRRTLFPSHDFRNGTDPVTNVLALLTTHWDESLDVAAWSRQISFLLSGFMLLASFNSALQTFLLLGRAFPGILSAFHANLALVVSQVLGTYVISSALLLRSNLRKDVGSAISDALGAPLEPRKVDAWFEIWFLAAALFTAGGIWLGRHFGGSEFDDDLEGSKSPQEKVLQLGKMS